jgi:hypothetical protein
MKKLFVIVALMSGFVCVVPGQNNYKQNFLNFFKKIPDIKSCENSYNFFSCKNNMCNDYKATKAIMDKAFKEISDALLATNNALTSLAPQPGGTMTQEQADALSAKMDKMTDAEKQQWAMQNAQSMMNNGGAHANQDADNDVVNDAVNYATKQQQEDLKDAMKPINVQEQFKKIEDKYLPQKNSVLKTLQDALHDKNLTLSYYSYAGGEASDEEIARQTKAINDFKKSIAPVYDAELVDKLAYLKTLSQNLNTKYGTLEEKVAATHYGDDAEEAMNKNHLCMAQQKVLSNVLEIFGHYEEVLGIYADEYAKMQNMQPVKKFD